MVFQCPVGEGEDKQGDGHWPGGRPDKAGGRLGAYPIDKLGVEREAVMTNLSSRGMALTIAFIKAVKSARSSFTNRTRKHLVPSGVRARIHSAKLASVRGPTRRVSGHHKLDRLAVRNEEQVRAKATLSRKPVTDSLHTMSASTSSGKSKMPAAMMARKKSGASAQATRVLKSVVDCGLQL